MCRSLRCRRLQSDKSPLIVHHEIIEFAIAVGAGGPKKRHGKSKAGRVGLSRCWPSGLLRERSRLTPGGKNRLAHAGFRRWLTRKESASESGLGDLTRLRFSRQEAADRPSRRRET